MGSSPSKTVSSSSFNSSSSASNSPLETTLTSQTTATKAFSFPMPLIHHPPAKKGDTHHLVSLTSTTYGSLLLVDLDPQTLPQTLESRVSRSSLSPDSVINTWELMNGLDDELDSANCNSAINLESFSKPITNQDVVINGSDLKLDKSYETVRIEEEEEDEEEDWIPLPSKPKQPLWKHLSEESFLSDLDPKIISSYKKALSSKQLSKIAKSVSSNHQSVNSQTLKDQEKPKLLLETEENKNKNKNKIVLYFTSLRGIRKTYEDCCYVRSILRGFQVAVEERDISMDSNYRKELVNALGEEPKQVCLPHVFIKGIHIGGIEEIKILNDSGELREMLKDFPVLESIGACESCGDARFVLCTNCGGSTKVFEEHEDVFKRCKGCNENGLVRCNKCCV